MPFTTRLNGSNPSRFGYMLSVRTSRGGISSCLESGWIVLISNGRYLCRIPTDGCDRFCSGSDRWLSSRLIRPSDLWRLWRDFWWRICCSSTLIGLSVGVMTFGATYWTGPFTCWSHSSGTVEHFEMSEMLIVVLGILIASTFAGMSNITSSLTPLTTP